MGGFLRKNRAWDFFLHFC